MENEKRKKRKFSDEYKAEAVRMSDERRVSEVSRNLDISLSLLPKWRMQAKASKVLTGPLPKDLVEKCKKLESEVRRLKLEQEILKKATAFSEESIWALYPFLTAELFSNCPFSVFDCLFKTSLLHCFESPAEDY